MIDFLNRFNEWLTEKRHQMFLSFGLLLLRVSFGIMMLVGHGWDKLIFFSEKASSFPSPVGLGGPVSLFLVVFAEVFCSLAIVIGLATRLAAVPLVITLVVAAFVMHGDDPWQRKEAAVLYLVPFLTLVFSGAGSFSLDAVIRKRRKRNTD